MRARNAAVENMINKNTTLQEMLSVLAVIYLTEIVYF